MPKDTPQAGSGSKRSVDSAALFFKKIAQSRPLFNFFFVFSNKKYNIYNKSLWKNVHPVYGAGIRTNDLSNLSCHPWPLDQGSHSAEVLGQNVPI